MAETEAPAEPPREALVARQTVRARRRPFLRWRRRRLALDLLVIERELADAPDDLREYLRQERARIEQRWAENARKLFR